MSSSQAVQVLVGRYQLLEQIGQGGMGLIWLALDQRLQRKVAIKLMHQPQRQGTWRARFETEGRAIARLQHPNVVQIFDYGVTEEGAPFIVMEFLEGESLSARLKRVKAIPIYNFISIFTQIAKGLHAAHQAGVIHRDLKPANIFLTSRGDETVAKILDFGVAAVRASYDDASSELTEAKQLLGTPHYMSPEQALAKTVDHRTDLWALGVVAYRALTGRLPFSADVVTAVLLLICSSSHAHPSLVTDRVDSSVDGFFSQALAKSPNDRFSDAHEMAVEFAKLMPDGANRGPITILVIDDEPDVERLFTQQFRRKIRAGAYVFEFAHNGANALDKLSENPDIDIAFTDINMPVMDGFGFLERASEISPTLKTVVVSGYGDMNNIRRAMNSGAFDFLTKPIDFKDLQATLVKSAREVRELRRGLRTMEENHALRSLVAPGIMRRLLPFIETDRAAQQTLEATVLVLRLVDRADPATLEESPIARTNHYLDRAADQIVRAEGTVLRFISRFMIAQFRGEQHLSRAIGASRNILHQLAKSAGPEPDATPAMVGAIAISSGPVTSGRVGSASTNHLEFGLLGDPVDSAVRNAMRTAPGIIAVPSELSASVPEPCMPVGQNATVGRTDEPLHAIIWVDDATPEPST